MTAVPAPPRPVHPVGILAARLDDLVRRLEAGGVDRVRDAAFAADLAAARDLAAGLDPYVEAHTSPESPALAALAARTAGHDWDDHGGGLEQEMLSGHVEGRLLGVLVKATGARRVLEIGLFTGYSALAMAEALPEDGVVVACELDAGVARFAQDCFDASPAGRKVDVRVGPALDTLAALADAGEVFDLVFVDADKAGYRDYLDVVLSRGLLAPGGLLAVDNTLMQGQPWLDGEPTPNGEAIAAFNRAISDDPRLEQVLVPVRDGLTLAVRS